MKQLEEAALARTPKKVSAATKVVEVVVAGVVNSPASAIVD